MQVKVSDKVKIQAGQFLRECRKAKGYTQVEVARHFKVSQQMINNWEAGRQIPSVDYLTKVAVLYGVNQKKYIGFFCDILKENFVKGIKKNKRYHSKLKK